MVSCKLPFHPVFEMISEYFQIKVDKLAHFNIFHRHNLAQEEKKYPLMAYKWWSGIDKFQTLILDEARIACGTSAAFFGKNLAKIWLRKSKSDHYSHFKYKLKEKTALPLYSILC